MKITRAQRHMRRPNEQRSPSAELIGRPIPLAEMLDEPPLPVRESTAVESPVSVAPDDNLSAWRVLHAIERSASSMRIVPALALIGALWWCQVVLIPIVLALVISYALEPLVARLEFWHLRRVVGAPLVLLSVLALLGGSAYSLRGELAAFVGQLPEAAHTLSQAIQHVSTREPGTMAKVRAAARELESAARQSAPTDGVTAVRVEEPSFKWSEWLWSGSRNFAEFVAQMFVVLCLTYYLLAAGDLYKRKLVRMVPTLTDKKVTVQILAEVDRQIERFLLARVAISFVVAFVIGIGFWALGVDNAGVWAVLAAVLFAIPVAGPVAFIVAAGIASVLQFESPGLIAAVTALCVVTAAVEGNVLTPWLMSRAGDMNAVAVFVSLLFWGWIWGLWGVLLAFPITAAIKAVSERIPDMQPIAEFLKE